MDAQVLVSIGKDPHVTLRIWKPGTTVRISTELNAEEARETAADLVRAADQLDALRQD
jgi:hypothetical protein